MAEQLRGCHHCIGTAHTVTELIFNLLKSRAAANGGHLSAENLDKIHEGFRKNFTAGFNLFEAVHRNCMEASGSTKPDLFSRAAILQTLLSACCQNAAARAFKTQIQWGGQDWLNDFFFAFGKYVREHINAETETRLIGAYVEAAAKYKATLSLSDLLHESDIRDVLLECSRQLCDTADAIAESASASINDDMFQVRAVAGPQIARTTTKEVKEFLTLLPHEIALVFSKGEIAGAPRPR